MPALPGLAACTFLSTLPGGQQVANTFHIANAAAGTAPSTADIATLATDLATFFETAYRGLLTTDSTFDAIKVAQVPDPTIHGDPYADFLLPLNVAGTRTVSDARSPAQACAVLSEKTNSGQRSYRGHLMLPPALHASELNGNSWNAGGNYYLAVLAFKALLQDGAGPSPTWTGSKLSSYTLSIYSKTLQTRGLPSVTGVITVVANLPVHWLRSRARGTS